MDLLYTDMWRGVCETVWREVEFGIQLRGIEPPTSALDVRCTTTVLQLPPIGVLLFSTVYHRFCCISRDYRETHGGWMPSSWAPKTRSNFPFKATVCIGVVATLAICHSFGGGCRCLISHSCGRWLSGRCRSRWIIKSFYMEDIFESIKIIRKYKN